jgi:cytidylate kinase
MAVITISRGSFSGGKMLAECLAHELGYRCIDRDVIVEKAAAAGASQESLREALAKPPTFWDRFTHTRYRYLTIIQAALCEEVSGGSAVYHGNAGHLLLHGVSHVLRARIVAPISFRTATVQERLKLPYDGAVAYIERMDRDRERWTQYLYNVDWRDPSLYDIVLNLEALNIRQACLVIATTVRQDCFAETEESRAAMRDLMVASRVRAALAVDEATQAFELQVTASDGAVSVIGKLPRDANVRAIEEVALRVAGVSSVEFGVFGPAEA